ncbi:MAG: chemotaxis protein CheW [Bacteroidales bacterium]|jgi:purine-binding chemotaxis protein CheW
MKKEIRTKLKNRAIVMAKEPEQKRAASAILEVIAFTLATETYGIESAFVREVYPLREFTSLPGVPSYIFGIINVRGQILPVVDLKKFFNLPEKGLGELNKVIILNNEQMEFGILADVIHGTKSIEIEDIRLVPPTVSGIGEEYLKGVTKESLIVLNAVKLLSDKDIVVNEVVT